MKTINLPKTLKPITQGELAQRLKISQTYLSLILNNKRKPSARLAEKLKKYGVGIDCTEGKKDDKRLTLKQLQQVIPGTGEVVE